MPELIVCAALAFVVATYVLFSLKDGSWFNILTPQIFLGIPTLYIAQLGRLYLGVDARASNAAWAFVYACYCLPLAIFAWTISHASIPIAMRIRTRRPLKIRASPWVLLGLGVLLYAPILIEFRASLLSPRSIYEQTRTGYGLYFFLSTMLAMLGFVLYLFKTRSVARRLGFAAMCMLLSLSHGSKGLVIYLTLLWLLHWRYADGRRVPLRMAAALLGGLSAVLVVLFYLFSSGVELGELAASMFGYSDYTANGLMIVDDDKPALWGRIFFEDNVYSRIPRAIFPDKPKDFGSFLLAEIYFPESFELDQGVPAFGVGATFADFKWFSLPILCLANYLLGLLVRSLRNALARFRHPADFVVLAFLSGVPLLSVGVGFLLPEHMLLAVALTLALRLRLRHRHAKTAAHSRAPAS
ncbi:MAG TPA: hypothetical protein VF453_17035 [Burkholderiaceae bacterium]